MSKALVFAALAMASAIIASGSAVSAQTIRSAYTTFDPKKCRHERGRAVESYGSWLCPGYRGLRVLLSAGDQRMYVTYGPWKKNSIASSQTFPGFNSVYEGTVEWRIEKLSGGKKRPFATILRWNIKTDQENTPSRGRVLVVTRLDADGVCHVGYVDALANPDADVLARQLADEKARAFRCGSDKPIVVGKVSPDLFMPKAD